MDVPLSPEDLSSVKAAQDELVRQGWTIRLSIDQMVSGWTSLVAEVEMGYDMCIYEYTNDLSVRDYAERVAGLATRPVADRLADLLAEPDDRFRAATTATERRLPGAKDTWWRYRKPRVLVGELANDIEELNL